MAILRSIARQWIEAFTHQRATYQQKTKRKVLFKDFNRKYRESALVTGGDNLTVPFVSQPTNRAFAGLLVVWVLSLLPVWAQAAPCSGCTDDSAPHPLSWCRISSYNDDNSGFKPYIINETDPHTAVNAACQAFAEGHSVELTSDCVMFNPPVPYTSSGGRWGSIGYTATFFDPRTGRVYGGGRSGPVCGCSDSLNGNLVGLGIDGLCHCKYGRQWDAQKRACVVSLCATGEAVTGAVEDLQDNCYSGCEITNLSPTEDNKWVRTLRGEKTGQVCSEAPKSDVKVQKMLACGTAGSSGYSTKTAHPIDFAVGNKFFRDTDYRGSGSFPIVFGRTYNSYNLGWRISYTQRIDSLSVDKVAVRRPGGQSYEFTFSGDNWVSDPDVVDRLEWLAEANGGAGGWIYTLANNSRELFDANGRLMAIRNPAGLEQTLVYSADQKEMTIRDPNGDVLTVTLNDTGLLPVSITDKTGHTTSYAFNGVQLEHVTYPNGTHKQYLYEKQDRPWLITGIIDENGHRSHTVAYDDYGRAIMSELADGADRVDISYNSDGTTTLTNALGKKTRFHFQTIHGVKKIVKVEGEPTATCQGTAMAYQFDDNGFVTEKTDAKGITTQYTRDAQGLELSRTDAVDLPESRTVTTEWDSELRKPLVVTKADTEIRYSYDSEGRTLSRTISDRATGASRTTSYTYNNDGLLESVDGPRVDVADITHYSYDADGRLSQVTNALGHATDIVSRDSYGRPLVTRDANGLETTLTYDDEGRLTRRQVGSETTTMTYDAVGNLTEVSSSGGVTLRYDYDNANRLVRISDSVGNHIDYTLDAMGHKISEKVTDSQGQLTHSQQKTYDELGRLLTSVGAEGQTTSYGYDRNDNLIRTIDPLWQVYENAYDGLNRLIQQSDPKGGITVYGYDAGDRLLQVTDPNGNATHYDYDGLGNLIAQHSPDTGTTTYSHDAAGNILSKTDAKGQSTTYTYDVLNRLTQTSYADGTSVTYSYDSAEHGIGRLAQIIDASGDTAWQYDLQGHTTARIQTIQLDGHLTQLTTRYNYNGAGQLSEITYPSGMKVGYNYSKGKISAITINGQPLLNAITYQPFGPVSGWTWSNGNRSQRGYDLDGRLISQSLGSITRTLAYDANGNIAAITEPSNSQLFGYDELNRLTAANDATFNLGWTYDANGNRLSETEADIATTYSIDIASNRLMAVGDTAYQYDANGNLINDGEHSYQYNAQNRLISVDEGATGEYRYNAMGQRIFKKGVAVNCDVNGDGTVDQTDLHRVNGKNGSTIDANGPGKGEAKGKGQQVACVATKIGAYANNGQGKGVENKAQSGSRQRLFSYDEHRLLGEYDTQGNSVQETVWLSNLPVATFQNNTVYYIHADHLGTPRVITDSSNTEVWRWDSDPFGASEANEDPDGDGKVVSFNLRFAGQYYDEETGKYYNYFRDYDPGTGRYVESDPIGLEGGINIYGYSLSNPNRYSDPYGLKSCKCQYTTKDAPYIDPIHREYLLFLKATMKCNYWCWVEGDESKKELVSIIHSKTAFLYEALDDFFCPYVVASPQHWEPSASLWIDGQPIAQIFDPLESPYSEFKSWAKSKGCGSCGANK